MKYNQINEELLNNQKSWLITGAAGFIGSNLAEELLKLNQKVISLDNFATGHRYNLEHIKNSVTSSQWENFTFVEGDISNYDTCKSITKDVDIILHQAALGSVPRSIDDPVTSNNSNVTGFLNMLTAAKDNGIKRFVYASSSSVYGDSQELPKVEERTGNLLSPYAVTKYVNELYAGVFHKCYGIETIGLRYFNVFGKRQDPNGAYAAVIPKWIGQLLNSEDLYINGDGETSRDFTYISNVVQANILAGMTENKEAFGEAFNTAVGGRETLNNLYRVIANCLKDFILNTTVLNTFMISDQDSRNYIKILNRKKPALIRAYVQSIYELATFAKKNKIKVEPQKAIHTAAGILYEFMREEIEDVFNCRVFSHYSSREVGSIASECRTYSGLHIMKV